MPARSPLYFDGLITGFHAGQVGRFVHLGAWDAAPAPAALAEPGAFERAQRALNDRLLALADLADGQRVLDVGCGFGGTLQAVDARHRRMDLAGINIDRRQLDICRGPRLRDGNTARWLLADACALPLPDASVDRLLCIEAMFHFDTRRRFFGEAARVLAPGGVMVASDILLRPMPAAAGSRDADAELQRAIGEGFGPWPDFWGRDADHRALAAAAGLVCTHHIDASRATLPSHDFTAPAVAAPGDAVGRAAATLAALHRAGRLSYVLLRFERALA